MPRNKSKKAPPPPDPIELAPADEQLKGMQDILKQVLFHMDRQNKSRNLILEFQRKCGKNSVTQMSKKEKDKATVLYKQHLQDMVESSQYINNNVDFMRKWRNNAVVNIQSTSSLNTIELLKLKAGCLSIWDPETNPLGHGAGGMGWPDDKRIEKGEEVVAFLETAKTWILAEVIGPVSNHRYECVDVDDNERKVSVFARKQLIPLPTYTVDYRQHPNMALPKQAMVLALYPGTTCFYEGLVFTSPERASGIYTIRFIDNEISNKYSEPLEVPDRYVVVHKKDPVIYVRPSKRVDAGAQEQQPKDQPEQAAAGKSKKKTNKKKKKNAEEKTDVIDDKDIPGPAPPPLQVVEVPEVKPARQRSKSTDKKRSKSSDKPKIIRAKVPEHKKVRSTRQFGKRKRKQKKGSASAEKPVTEGSSEVVANVDAEEAAEERPNVPAEEEAVETPRVLTGMAQFGLEEELEETDSEDDVKNKAAVVKKDEEEDEEDSDEEESEDEDDDDKDDSDEDEEKKDPEAKEESDEGEQKDEKMEVDEKEKSDDEDDDEDDDEKDEKKEATRKEEIEPTVEPHDPEEGTSSGPRRYANESDSDSDYLRRRRSSSSSSSDAQSGISVSDNERNRRNVDSDEEEEKK